MADVVNLNGSAYEPASDNEKPAAPVFTEVRVRQFFKGPDGTEILPTFVYYMKDGVSDVDVQKMSAEITKQVAAQLPFPITSQSVEEISNFLASEITVGSSNASQAKASLAAIPKPKAPEVPGLVIAPNKDS